MQITELQYEQLVRIFNTLMLIKTSGEDTFIMSDALKKYQQLMLEIQECQKRIQEE